MTSHERKPQSPRFRGREAGFPIKVSSRSRRDSGGREAGNADFDAAIVQLPQSPRFRGA